MSWLWAVVWLATAAVGQDNLLANPGLEAEGGWEGLGNGFVRDPDVAHEGAASARCSCATVGEASGLWQTVVLDRAAPRPLRLSVWTRGQVAGGRPGAGYSLWADVEYVQDTRPGRVDLPGVRVDCPLSGEWQRCEVLIVPEQPVKQVRVHGLFRQHYAGTVWFDAFALVELDQMVLSVDREPPPLPLTAAPAPAVHRVEAGGLRLDLAADGSWSGVSADGQPCTVGPAGLAVGDFFEGEWRFLSGTATAAEGGVEVAWSQPRTGLRGELHYRPKGEAIEVSGAIRDTRGEDRAVDLLVWLPLAADGLHWEEDFDTRVALQPDSWPATEESPVAAVRHGDEAPGLGLALSPWDPCRFRLGVARPPAFVAAGVAPLYARLSFGLAAETRTPGTATFRLLLSATAPGWGLRDLARRWYAAYPDAFERRATKEGLWQFAIDTAKLPNPHDYGYHEGGADSLTEDEPHGILTCPYLIPGQLALYHMAELPRTIEEVEALLDSYEPRAADRGGVELVDRIRNCVARDAEGRYTFVARDDVGADIKPAKPINNVVFSVNCDPDLFADRGLPTAGGLVLDQARRLLTSSPGIGGIYLDSASGWIGRATNYRRDHFAYADEPLTHDATGRVCLDGQWHVQEFMRAMGDLLHPAGKVVFPNLSYGRAPTFLYPVSDVIGLEGHGVDLGRHRLFRLLSASKPILRLSYLGILGRETELATPEGMSWYVKACAEWGIEPAIGRRADEAYRNNQALLDAYLPVIREVASAGWRPVTHATCDKALVERFGEGGTVYLTLLNPGAATVTAEVHLDLAATRMSGTPRVVELVGGQRVPATVAAHQLSLSLALGAADCRVLRLSDR